MFCKKCGKFIEADMVYCPGCGRKVVENNSSVSKIKIYDEEAIKMEQQGAIYDDEEDSESEKLAKALAIVIVTALFAYAVFSASGIEKLGGKIKDFFEGLGSIGSIGTSAYYKDDTVRGALDTYLNALKNDDYETYLKITRKDDNDSSKREFNDRKKGYTSVDSIPYCEVKTGSLFGFGAKAEYMIAVYNSDGTQKENYSYLNGEAYTYGLVVISETAHDSGVYYVSLHDRDFNFNYDY